MSEEKAKLLNKTKFILDEPQQGYITKIYPTPGDNVKLPYRPAESRRKKYYTKKGNKLVRTMTKKNRE